MALQQGSGGIAEQLAVGLALPTSFLLGCFMLGHLLALGLAPGQQDLEETPPEPTIGASEGSEAVAAAAAEHSGDQANLTSAVAAVLPSKATAFERIREFLGRIVEVSGYVVCGAGVAWWMSQGAGGPTSLQFFVAISLLATLGAVARWRLSAMNSLVQIGALHRASVCICKPLWRW